MVTGERLEEPKQWGRLGEDSDSAEGKPNSSGTGGSREEAILRCHANPKGQEEAHGVGAGPPEEGLFSAHYTAWAQGPGGRSCQMGMNGNSQEEKRP